MEYLSLSLSPLPSLSQFFLFKKRGHLGGHKYLYYSSFMIFCPYSIKPGFLLLSVPKDQEESGWGVQQGEALRVLLAQPAISSPQTRMLRTQHPPLPDLLCTFKFIIIGQAYTRAKAGDGSLHQDTKIQRA